MGDDVVGRLCCDKIRLINVVRGLMTNPTALRRLGTAAENGAENEAEDVS